MGRKHVVGAWHHGTWVRWGEKSACTGRDGTGILEEYRQHGAVFVSKGRVVGGCLKPD